MTRDEQIQQFLATKTITRLDTKPADGYKGTATKKFKSPPTWLKDTHDDNLTVSGEVAHA